ncbi:hypothetical protein JW968_00585 [Candidatus Woesearchaeota archaeon]|nr:hypothetical protein [Candidatus Woesearchaeota archaeon]
MKKGMVLTLTTVLTFLTIPSVNAQTGNNILEPIYKVFGFVFDLIRDNNISGEKEVFYAKFMLWIILFSILLYASKFVFPNQKGVGGTIAAVISIIALIPLKGDLLTSIFEVYGVVAAFLFFMIPIVGLMFINHKLFHDNTPTHAIGRFLVYMLVLFTFLRMKGAFDNQTGWFSQSMASMTDYMNLFVGVMVLLLIWSFIQIFSAFSGGGSTTFSGGSGGGGFFSGANEVLNPWNADRRARRHELKDLRHRAKLEGREKKLEDERAKQEAINSAIRRLDSLETRDVDTIITELETIARLVENFGGMVKGRADFHDLVHKIFIQDRETKKLIEELKTLLGKEESLNDIERRIEEFIRKADEKAQERFKELGVEDTKIINLSNRLKASLQEELKATKIIEQYVRDMERNESSFSEMMRIILTAIKKNNTPAALSNIATARNLMIAQKNLAKNTAIVETRIQQIIQNNRTLETAIEYAIRREVAKEKRAVGG